ncbi:hypothetical protein [Sulfobacillus harzensis]|uniref:Uncharacterized protein n=1 Tax=Sulfobacillus harzensis TaxID=2729629 RepID=A0A7Y0L770_9FIRM|nr:hypothetical protein [Sulfobacillus harzensis]NMP24490.1 hypothetical protein [Sulfobacillus harzensis]
MLDVAFIAFGILSGLAFSIVWRLVLVKLRVILRSNDSYEADLSQDREKQRTKSAMRRNVWHPVGEEAAVRGLPMALWLFCPRIAVLNILGVAGIYAAAWIASHIVETGKRWYSFKVLSHLSSTASIVWTAATMVGQTLSYSLAWLVASFGPLVGSPWHRSVLILIRGFLAGSLVHALHNFLILDPGWFGQGYRRIRLIHSMKSSSR